MKANSLFKTFIILSVISFILTGSMLSIFIHRQIIQQEINHNIETVHLTLGHSLEHWFEGVDIDNLTEYDIFDLDKEFESLHTVGNIYDIRMWLTPNELIYASDKSLIGVSKMDSDLFDAVINGDSVHIIFETEERPNQFQNTGYKEMIIIYEPIFFKGHNVGVFEVYRPFDQSRTTINNGLQSVLLILTIGLVILYGFLARVIFSSSNRLIVQNHEIMQQTDALQKSYEELNKLYISMIKAITKAIDARDKFTSGHSQRVAEQSVAFGRFLNLDDASLNRLEESALLHDIGKLGIPESIINKEGKLTETEYLLMKNHPIIGKEIIEDIEAFKDIIDGVRYHHERYDGTGYPQGLNGKDIPFIARLLSLTDAFDSMVSNRPYRYGLPRDKALQEIIDNAGTQFDPDLSKSFIEFLENGSIDNIEYFL